MKKSVNIFVLTSISIISVMLIVGAVIFLLQPEGGAPIYVIPGGPEDAGVGLSITNYTELFEAECEVYNQNSKLMCLAMPLTW